MNKIFIAGQILNNTEKAPNLYRYNKGEGEKKSVLTFHISVMREHAKKDENGYFPSDIFQCKVFGANADYINEYYGPQNGIVLSGRLGVEQGGMKEDGTRYPSRVVIYVDAVEKTPEVKHTKGQASESTVAPTPMATPKKKFAPSGQKKSRSSIWG